MKEKLSNKYVMFGITLFLVFASLIVLFFLIYKWPYIFAFLKTLLKILAPFIYGFAISYIMNPVIVFFQNKVFNKLIVKIFKKEKPKLSRFLAIFTSTLILLGILIGLFSYLIPELLSSIEMFISNVNVYLSNSKDFLLSLFHGNEVMTMFINDNYKEIASFFNSYFNEEIFNNAIGTITNGIKGFFSFSYNFIIGYIIAIYILKDKDKFNAQIKKFLYALFNKEHANIILENARYTDKVFGGFFVGKLLDSLIIGILCFLGMVVFKLPYALIISVLVGVTNIIPYFGPFIGAIPSAILIFLVDPSKCIPFLIFILVLQQLDGNLIGPFILGNKTGLSSFWVLFSLLVFGGLFGVVGMIIGVPLFSIIYSFVNGLLKRRLASKNLPIDSSSYDDLLYIDEKNGKFIKKKS